MTLAPVVGRLLVALVVAGLLAVGQAGATSVSFATPAEARGTISGTNGTWLMVSGHGGGSIVADLDASDAYERITYPRVSVQDMMNGNAWDRFFGFPSHERNVTPPELDRLDQSGRDTYFHVRSSNLEWTLRSNATVEVAAIPAGGCMYDRIPAQQRDDTSVPPQGRGPCFAAAQTILFVVAPPGEEAAIEFSVTGATETAWHNMEPQCGDDSCWDASQDVAGEQQTVAGNSFNITNQRFHHLRHADSPLHGTLRGNVLALGGPRLDLQLEGWMRLPDLHVQGPCPDPCPLPEFGVWQSEGQHTLAALQPANDRMESDVQLDADWTRIDEQMAPAGLVAALSTSQKSVAVVAAIGIAFLLRFLAPLITRVSPDEALLHPRRRAIHGYVLAHPGATLREVMEHTNLAAGTTRHHLGILTRSRVLVEHRHRTTLRYFENHGRYEATWHSQVMLREPALRTLHAWLAEAGPKMQREILDHAELNWRWGRSTTQHRLGRLASAALLDVRPQGRRKVYSAVGAEEAQRKITGEMHAMRPMVGPDGMPLQRF